MELEDALRGEHTAHPESLSSVGGKKQTDRDEALKANECVFFFIIDRYRHTRYCADDA